MLYTLVWAAIFLVPFMNSHLMAEDFKDFKSKYLKAAKKG
jgi:hypothetical protein